MPFLVKAMGAARNPGISAVLGGRLLVECSRQKWGNWNDIHSAETDSPGQTSGCGGKAPRLSGAILRGKRKGNAEKSKIRRRERTWGTGGQEIMGQHRHDQEESTRKKTWGLGEAGREVEGRLAEKERESGGLPWIMSGLPPGTSTARSGTHERPKRVRWGAAVTKHHRRGMKSS